MIYKRTEQVEWRKFENESLLLNVSTGTYFRINEVGSLIWENLDGKRTDADLVQIVIKRFDVTETDARRDFVTFINQLLKDNLVTKVDPDEP
jgi:hypothetical protein